MTVRMQCTSAAGLRRWTQSGQWPDIRNGDVFDCKDAEAPNLAGAGLAVVVDPSTPLTIGRPAHQARGIPGFATGTTNG